MDRGREGGRERAAAMAVSASNIIYYNRRTLRPPTLSFSKLQIHSKFTILGFPSLFQHPHHSYSPTSISLSASPVAKAASSFVEVDDYKNSFDSTAATSSWPEFARNVSGEWDGYGADFSSEGKPIELPEIVVPEAYREWEVKVFDWQTQCPTLAEPEDHTVAYKLIKLLPTVGCEADAATRYSIDERNIGGSHNSLAAFAYQSTGCYVALWPMEDGLFELEHCLIDPQNKESRVRIIQVLLLDNTRMVLQNIQVFCEQWYGPFRNGEQLGGCAIRDSAFASTDAMKSSEVVGVWQASSSVASFHSSQTNVFQELVEGITQKSARDGDDLILLPKQLWCSVSEREDGDTCCEVGWLLDRGHAMTSRCIFSKEANLKEIAVARESLAVEGA